MGSGGSLRPATAPASMLNRSEELTDTFVFSPRDLEPIEPLRISQQKAMSRMAKKMAQTTHFNFSECMSLLHIHHRLTLTQPMKARFFRNVIGTCFNIFNNFLVNRLHHVFDRDENGTIDAEEWLIGLSVFMRGDLDEQIEFCYCVYDINGDGALEREELMMFLGGCLKKGDILDGLGVQEGVKELVDITMKKLDVNGDGEITFSDFKDACYKDPLLMQSCGLFLPAGLPVRAFGIIFTPHFRFYSPVYHEAFSFRGQFSNDKIQLKKSNLMFTDKMSFIKRKLSAARSQTRRHSLDLDGGPDLVTDPL